MELKSRDDQPSDQVDIDRQIQEAILAMRKFKDELYDTALKVWFPTLKVEYVHTSKIRFLD